MKGTTQLGSHWCSLWCCPSLFRQGLVWLLGLLSSRLETVFARVQVPTCLNKLTSFRAGHDELHWCYVFNFDNLHLTSILVLFRFLTCVWTRSQWWTVQVCCAGRWTGCTTGQKNIVLFCNVAVEFNENAQVSFSEFFCLVGGAATGCSENAIGPV